MPVIKIEKELNGGYVGMYDADVPYKRFKFPVGEDHIKLEIVEYERVYGADVTWDIESGDVNVMELLLVVDAIRRAGWPLGVLRMPYVPFSRQDRCMVPGEPFSLKVFCDLINGCGFKGVHIVDPHSDVTPALLNNCYVTTQADVFAPVLKDRKGYWLVAPDAGAIKKIYKLAKQVDCYGVIECTKRRDRSAGEIIGVTVHDEEGRIFEHDDVVVVDDICDGGRSFVVLLEAFRKKHGSLTEGSKFSLMVTHGFFTKGLDVLDKYSEILTRKGRVK
jgi:ribose-phosphate pyrophosphokinase